MLAGVACANVEPPPGGPLDAQPPALVRVVPESGAIVSSLKDAVVLQFDEVIDEMGGGGGGRGGGGGFGGGGAAGLDAQILLSPVTGDVEVSWRRTAIAVKPREGWRRGRVYRLELLPGIRDLRGNRLVDGRVVVFSTGPAIPTAVLSGTALDWTAQRALARGLIRVAPRGDTTGYLARVDSAGGFRLGAIAPGDYVVHAVQDENGNRRLDRREAYDSAQVRLDSSATMVLWTFVHDTAGPRLRSADPLDSVTFRLVFAQHLDPSDRPDTARVRLLALPDSTPVPLAQVLWPPQYDSLTRAAADSARRAQADTTPGPRAPAAPAAKGPPAAAAPAER
ncbi:MAG: Ig-like domain-containing protein, partial [Gemmatimonadales bacterium]